ncbi:ATP-binding protein [Candidatus Endomicrobiellum agilis]|uniref:ATP-binding protein n=1 Tax=Candidatus Endomicrobiellum agilis TaxID=3238957 RepID=UPI0035773BD5|nr:ATP-binding protein [Endomicrobium sp.]
MIERPEYLRKLIGFKDKQLIKIITGIRRCGKSTLLKLFQDYLLHSGVDKAQIQSINLEDVNNEKFTDYSVLHKHIEDGLLIDKTNYIFLDEIQNVGNFQKVVDSLYIKKNVDLYVTGSNAYMFSGQIATLLSGRYVEIPMLPLSFKEYISAFKDNSNLPQKFRDYLENSSFPYAVEFQGNKEQINDYLRGIYNTIVLKDVIERKNISSVSRLESVIRFMFNNIGNLSSIKKISDTMSSDGRKMHPATVENYLDALLDSYILYRVGRYDIKGKQYLKTNEKYYLVDIGFRYFLLGNANADIGHILENVIYLELVRRGCRVYIGKAGTNEIDFVALKNGKVEYYQAAQSIIEQSALKRELTPLNAINDHNPKYLITMDYLPASSYNGIQRVNALDWLVGIA